MFERFTERARQVVVLAQDEARALGHNYVGTEHLLLGLLREEEGLGARVLGSLDITVEEARAQVARIIGEGDEVITGQIPFTPRAKKVLELALREALGLKHGHVGTEHILLGLARENEGVAARILLDFDADAEKVRREVYRSLGRAPVESGDDKLRRTLEQISAERDDAIEAQDFDRAARLREVERELRSQLGLRSGEEGGTAVAAAPPRRSRMAWGGSPLLLGWALATVSLGLGILLGWAIWGLG